MKLKTKKAIAQGQRSKWITPVILFLAIVIATLFVFIQRAQMDQGMISEMKQTLLKLHDAEAKIYEKSGEYSLDLENVWKDARIELKAPSHFVYGFQRNCVHKYFAHIQVTNTYETSPVFEGIRYQEVVLKIKDGVLTFLNPEGESAQDLECLDPKKGYLLYAVGARRDGNLDVWIVNHEKTVANIRPEESGGR